MAKYTLLSHLKKTAQEAMVYTTRMFSDFALATADAIEEMATSLSQRIITETLYLTYTADKIDNDTAFYVDIADMCENEGIYKRRARGITGSTVWRDLVSGANFRLSSNHYTPDGIVVANGVPLEMELSSYLRFKDGGSFSIAFSAKFEHTVVNEDVFAFGGTRKIVVQRNGAYGLRLITYDSTGTQRTYPTDRTNYIIPASYGVYHHYVVVFDTSDNTVTWYQDGKVARSDEMAASSIDLQGGYHLALMNGSEESTIGLQYMKVVSRALTSDEVLRIYREHSSIDYRGDFVRYDDKLRELDAAKADRTASVAITIPTTGWVSDTSVAEYPYCYDISVKDITTNDRAIITIAPNSQQAAITCRLCPTNETLAGKIRIRAAKIPTASISAEYWIEKGVD